MKQDSLHLPDREKWTGFVQSHPHGNIFQTPEMYDVYLGTKHYEPVFVLLEKEGEILGLLLAVIQKSFGGIPGRATARAIVWGGPLVNSTDTDALEKILKEYNKAIANKAVYTQFRNLWSWTGSEKEIFRKNGFRFEDHLDIIHDLTVPPEEQMMKMHQGRRKNIRRAMKLNLVFSEVTSGPEFDESLRLVRENYRRIKLPFPDMSHFREAFRILGGKGNLRTFVLKDQEEIIGVRMVLCYKDLIYDWYAGSSDDHLDKYPNDYLPWKVMEWGNANNYRTFDFGGAGKPDEKYGVRDYKIKFGGETENYGRMEHIHNKMLYMTGTLGIKVYKLIK
jgi:serine/alanine adding enzyme